MTMLPVQGKYNFQGKLLGLKLSRLVALAYPPLNYTEANSMCKN